MMTPYYSRDGITIFCGEASEVLSQLEPGTIDLTVTSPPYDRVDYDDAGNLITYSAEGLRTYNGYTWDFAAIASQLWRVTTKGGVVVWVVGDATVNGSETGTSFRQALHFMGLGFNLHDTMIYDKNGFRYPFPDKYHQVFEYMFILARGTISTFNPINDRPIGWNDSRKVNTKREADGTITTRKGRDLVKGELSKRFNIWRYSNGKGNTTNDNIAFDHPAIFPEALARDHIISWSNPGNLVLDCFLGSGTTAKMAQHLGRRFVGCDVSEEYCQIAVDRLRQPSLFYSLPEPVKVEAKQGELGL